MKSPHEQPESKRPSERSSATCRVCGGAFKPDSPSAPFCSERCRLADLGKWFSGEYRISREIKDTDLDAGD